MTNIAGRIRKLLADHGWSERELARRAGFASASQLHGILRNLDRDEGAIQRATLQRIARGAGVSERWLLLGEGAGPGDDGFDAALREARRRAPELRDHAWRAVAEGGRSLLRGAVTPADVLRLARLADELADPARDRQ